MHNLYMGCCSAHILWAVVVHSVYGLLQCTFFMGCCSAHLVSHPIKP